MVATPVHGGFAKDCDGRELFYYITWDCSTSVDLISLDCYMEYKPGGKWKATNLLT